MKLENKYLKIVNTIYGKIVININDRFIGKSFSENKYWGIEDIKVISKFIDYKCKNKERIIFYDVGANIGSHTLALSKIFNNKIFIRSFEAQYTVHNMLKETIKINNLSNIKLYHNAVSDKDGEIIKIELPDYSKINNFGGLELVKPYENSDNNLLNKNGAFEEVKTISLDSFDEEVDFIKMDIEGMEHSALKGSKELILKYRPYLYVELRKTKKDELITFFKENKYEIFQKGLDAFILPIESKINITGLNKL